MKKFISGLIVGILICLPISALADAQLSVKENPFTIFVNGIKEPVEAYNINGSTYLKLSDIARVTDNAVDVKFDQPSQSINISTKENQNINEVGEKMETVTETEKREYTVDGIEISYYDGKPYISHTGFAWKYGYASRETNGVNFYRIADKLDEEYKQTGVFYLCFQENLRAPEQILLDNIPVEDKDRYISSFFIPLDYYLQNILPIVQP